MLTNKRAVVTGSTSGIGLAIARELASNGAHVVINGFGDADAIEKERVNLELEFGVKAHYINADLGRGKNPRLHRCGGQCAGWWRRHLGK